MTRGFPQFWPDLARFSAVCLAVSGHRANLHVVIVKIAAIVAGMPDRLGGKRMAIRVAELARAGLTPDWMPGAIPRCVPVEVKRNQHGERAATIVVGTERILTRGKWRSVEVLVCPVTFSPHPEQIDAARRAYDDWRQALAWVQEGLLAGGMLREVEVTAVMPKGRPWMKA